MRYINHRGTRWEPYGPDQYDFDTVDAPEEDYWCLEIGDAIIRIEPYYKRIIFIGSISKIAYGLVKHISYYTDYPRDFDPGDVLLDAFTFSRDYSIKSLLWWSSDEDTMLFISEYNRLWAKRDTLEMLA